MAALLSKNVFTSSLNSENLLIAAYRNLGVICFDSVNLSLYHIDPSLPVIKLHPPIPKSINITKILLNANGSKLALIGERTVFLVNINEDFWAYCSIAGLPEFNHIKPEYFSDVELLHPNISLGKNPLIINCCRWYKPMQPSMTGSSLKNYLGVLYSDNILSFDFPFISIDFQALLFHHEENPRFKNVLGIGINLQIIAFDFGPTYTRSDSIFGTILATDTEGDLYFAAFNFDCTSDFTSTPTGPLSFKTEFRNILITDVCDLVLVQHSFSNTVPVFAMATKNGIVSHALLVQSMDLCLLFDHGDNIFDIFIYDSLELPMALNIISLHNETSIPGQYTILNGNQVYTVDISPWLSGLYTQLSELSDSEPMNVITSDFKSSMVRHLFMSLSPCSDKENIQPVSNKFINTQNNADPSLIRCIISLELDLANDSNSYPLKNIVFIAISNSGRFFMNTIRHRLSTSRNMNEMKQQQKIIFKGPSLYDDVLKMISSKDSFPVISLEKFKEEERLKIATNATKSLSDKLNEKNIAFNEAENRAIQLNSQFLTISQSRNEIYKRLQNLLNSYATLKEDLVQKRDFIKRIEIRLNSISVRILSNAIPLTEAQKSILNRLEEITKKLRAMIKENAQISINILNERRQLMGSTKAFQASGRVQKFMLSKNSQEIARLTQSIKKINLTLTNL